MADSTRRQFNTQMLASVTAYGLIDMLFRHDLLAQAVKPVVNKWLIELAQLQGDLKEKKLKDVDFQAKLEQLYQRVELAELVKFLDLDEVEKKTRLPANGAANLGVDLGKVEGLPKVVFGKQIFACGKGRSIVPHGHDNMCTGFIILRGNWQGKHWDRIEDKADSYLMKPTIDRLFKPGDCSTVSDHKDNVHWFKAESDKAFLFNVHVMRYNPESDKLPRRVYVDPEAAKKQDDGLLLAPKMSSDDCHKKYG